MLHQDRLREVAGLENFHSQRILGRFSSPGKKWFRSFLKAGCVSALAYAPAAFSQDDPYQYLTNSKQILSPRDRNNVDVVAGKVSVEVSILNLPGSPTDLRLNFSVTGPVDFPETGADVETAFGKLFQIGNNFYLPNNTFLSDELGTVAVMATPVGGGMYRGHTGWAITNPDGTKYQPSLGPTNVTYFWNNGANEGVYSSDGTRVFLAQVGCCFNSVDKVVFPSGEVWNINYQKTTISGEPAVRLRSVTTNLGYTYEIQYQTDSSTAYWRTPSRVLVFNKANVYCNESLLALCSSTSTAISYVDFIYNNTNKSVTFRPKGETEGKRVFLRNQGSTIYTEITSVDHSAVAGSTVSYTYAVASEEGNDPYYERYVSSVTDPDGVWNYSYYRVMHEGRIYAESNMSRSGPGGDTLDVNGNLVFGFVNWMTLPGGREYTQGYDAGSGGSGTFRIVGVGQPEGNGQAFEHDIRGNVTKITNIPKSGSGLSSTQITATYTSDCINPKTCNKPLTVTDANNNTTTFTYDSSSGKIATTTGPLVNGVAPVKRYTYTQRYAWLKNSSGGYSQASVPVLLLAEERFCRLTATVAGACAGGASDEVTTSYDYGPNSGPNNLELRGKVVTADGVSLRTCFGYDALGNKISETSPRAALTVCP
jgi:YD repeat-containing protein